VYVAASRLNSLDDQAPPTAQLEKNGDHRAIKRRRWNPNKERSSGHQAPKARQIFSLGREPQEQDRPIPSSAEGATYFLPEA
jgi:hypothetical protein